MGTLRKLLLFLYTDSCRLYKLSLALPLIENFQHFYNKKTVYFIFIAVLKMRISTKGVFFGDFVRFSSLLGTNVAPKYV